MLDYSVWDLVVCTARMQKRTGVCYPGPLCIDVSCVRIAVKFCMQILPLNDVRETIVCALEDSKDTLCMNCCTTQLQSSRYPIGEVGAGEVTGVVSYSVP